MAKCWRCGGGKTITMTTTGTHVLPCPTCGGSGESASAPEDERTKVTVLPPPEVATLAIAKPPADDLARTGSPAA
jgi:hypothetical protein